MKIFTIFEVRTIQQQQHSSSRQLIEQIFIHFCCIFSRTRTIVNQYPVPGTSITSCAIYGCDLYIFTGKTFNGTVSSNPNDGKIFIYRSVVSCGGFCDVPIC